MVVVCEIPSEAPKSRHGMWMALVAILTAMGIVAGLLLGER